MKIQVRELLEQVKGRIMAAPDQYDQNDFCGTACCIAGHIDVIVNGLEVHNGRTATYDTTVAIERIATKALGETDPPWLFNAIENELDYEEDYDPADDPDCWPRDLSRAYDQAETPTERALVGCQAIDRYMEERGI